MVLVTTEVLGLEEIMKKVLFALMTLVAFVGPAQSGPFDRSVARRLHAACAYLLREEKDQQECASMTLNLEILLTIIRGERVNAELRQQSNHNHCDDICHDVHNTADKNVDRYQEILNKLFARFPAFKSLADDPRDA
jgi:hypothetical protein